MLGSTFVLYLNTTRRDGGAQLKIFDQVWRYSPWLLSVEATKHIGVRSCKIAATRRIISLPCSFN